MNRSTLTIILAVGVVLAVLNIYQFIDRQSLREQMAAQRLEFAGGAASPRRRSAEVERTPARPNPGTPTANRKSNRTPRSPVEPEPPKRDGFQELATKWAEMMENPVMQKQMQAQMEAQLGPALADLFAHLALEGEDLSHFKGLLAEEWLAQQQVGMKMMSAAGDPATMAAIQEDLKRATENAQANIREFLNDEADFAYFENYQKQLPDRMELEKYATSLAAEGLALRDGQKDHLLSVMAEERVASELGDISDPKGWDFENFTEGTVTEVFAKMTDFHQRVQERAGTMLDEEQVRVLASSQEQQRSMQEMGLRMGLEMMNSMKKEE